MNFIYCIFNRNHINSSKAAMIQDSPIFRSLSLSVSVLSLLPKLLKPEASDCRTECDANTGEIIVFSG